MVRVLKSLAFLGTSLKRTSDSRRSATLPQGGLFLRNPLCKIPFFDIDSVKSYLIDSPEKAFDGQSLRCYKQLRAYQLFDERHVHDLEANLWEKGEHFYFVRAKCWPGITMERVRARVFWKSSVLQSSCLLKISAHTEKTFS